MIGETNFHPVEHEARNYFKEKVYQTVIPKNVRLSEAHSWGAVVSDKNCPGSKSYYSFTDEFILKENNIGSGIMNSQIKGFSRDYHL